MAMIGRDDCRGVARHCQNAAKIATFKIALLFGVSTVLWLLRQAQISCIVAEVVVIALIAIRN